MDYTIKTFPSIYSIQQTHLTGADDAELHFPFQMRGFKFSRWE